jgi:hypothetical protein
MKDREETLRIINEFENKINSRVKLAVIKGREPNFYYILRNSIVA